MWVRNPRGALFLSIKSTCCRFTAASAQTEFNLWPWNKNYRIKQWISLFSRALFSLCHCCSDTRTQFFLHNSLIASHVLHHLANKVKVNSVSMIAPLLRRFFRRQLPLSKPIQKPTRFNLQNVLIWKVEGSFWKRLNRLPAARFRSCLVLEEATESHSSEVSEEISGCHFVSDWPMREWWNPPSSITSSAKTHGVRKQVWERERDRYSEAWSFVELSVYLHENNFIPETLHFFCSSISLPSDCSGIGSTSHTRSTRSASSAIKIWRTWNRINYLTKNWMKRHAPKRNGIPTGPRQFIFLFLISVAICTTTRISANRLQHGAHVAFIHNLPS